MNYFIRFNFSLLRHKLIFRILLIGFISALFSPYALAQTPEIYVNEVQASNVSTFPDIVDFGDFSDWIELYNNQTTPVNIGGFYITDDRTTPKKWQIPINTIIPAKGFYLVWADDFNDIPGKNYIRNSWPNNIPYTTQWGHTNFKLSKEGESVILYTSSGVLVDSLAFVNQIEDVSFGRKPDGSSNLFLFGEPTPKASNTTEGINSTIYAKDVIFSNVGGFYDAPLSLSLSSTDGSGIVRYTTNGSEPTSKSSVFSSPIFVSSTTIISARVFEAGKLPGTVVSSSYFINEERTLPAFSIIAERDYVMGRERGIYLNSLKDKEIPVNLEFFPIDGGVGFSQGTGMRIGGENIYRFAQKPLNIYARGDYGESQIDYKVFDHLPFQAYKRLYLRNSGDDLPYTMIRDGMISSLIRDDVSNSVQAYRPTVLYLNGDYWGIYNLREKLDNQYFSLHYNTSQADLDHLESDNTVIEGDATDYVQLLQFAGTNDLSDPTNYAHVDSLVDIRNLMDFVIVQSYLANQSWSHNREVWRDRGGENKWRWVLVDMDRGFNTSRISTNQINDIYSNFELFRYLTSNSSFKNEFVQRFSERVNSTFAVDRVVSLIDSLQAQIAPEMPRQIERWGHYIDSLSINDWGNYTGVPSMDSWNSEVQKFRTFAEQRPPNALGHLANQFGLGGRSTLTITSNIDNQGKVDINGFFKDIGVSGTYFDGVPIPLTAFAPPGFVFKSWKLLGANNVDVVLPRTSNWKYYDEATVPANWNSKSFDDTSWKSGNGILGYGDNQTTKIGYGGNDQNKFITSYYRSTFDVENLQGITGVNLHLLYDDGAVVYLNGSEVLRVNMPSGTISSNTEASSAVGGSSEVSYFDFTADLSALQTGTNVIAVEVHQSSPNSSDVSFDLEVSLESTNVSENPVVVSTNEAFNFTMSGDSQLMIEFEVTGQNFIAQTISEPTTLSVSNSPYFIANNVTVTSSGILTIEAGVEILVETDKGIFVNGEIHFNGTSESPITIRSFYPENEWLGVFFDNTKAPSSLNNVHISQAKGILNDENFFAAVSALNSEVLLNVVQITDIQQAISSQYSSMKILNSLISNVTLIGDYVNVNGGKLWIEDSIFEGNNIDDMDAIDIGFMNDTTLIKNNIFRNFVGSNSDGIDVGDSSKSVQIISNYITNCGDKAVSVGQGSKVYMSHNSISKCNLGVGIKDAGSYAKIDRNTFYGNNIGVSIYEKVLNRGGGSADITNTVFEGNANSAVRVDKFSSATIAYSISDTELMEGVNNLHADANLINPENGNFYPQIVSPAIDAADPAATRDSDGSRADMGAFSYRGFIDRGLVINEINYNSSDAFNPEDWVEFYNNSGRDLNISGYTFVDGSYKQTYVFDPETSLSSHNYIVVSRVLSLFSPLFQNVKNVVGPMTTGLSGSGESLYLYSNDGFLVDSVAYSDKSPWPKGSDGGGATLELISPDLNNAIASSWKDSPNHGTPGQNNSTYSSIDGVGVPTQFALNQNFPNPFNPSTTIKFQLPVSGNVDLRVYDIVGREVAVLVNAEYQSGFFSIEFDAAGLSSGVYIYRLQVSGATFVKKMVLLK